MRVMFLQPQPCIRALKIAARAQLLDEEIMELLRQIWERKKKPIPALV